MARKLLRISTVLALSAAMATAAQASPIIYTGASGALSASVSFDVSGSQLLIRLTNTSLGDPAVSSDILTGVIFTITGNPALTRISATLAPGSTVLRGTSGAGGSVGGEWAYSNQLSGQYIGQSATYAAGYFDGQATYPGDNLSGPASVGSADYGLTTLYDTAANDNGGLSKIAVISNAVDFVLGGLSSDFDLSWISGVSFQYGSSLSDPNITASCSSGCPSPDPRSEVPEPSTPLLVAAALAILALATRTAKPAKR
jgi:hypothetical protein